MSGFHVQFMSQDPWHFDSIGEISFKQNGKVIQMFVENVQYKKI